MPALRKDLRSQLEKAVLAARRAAEAGGREALTALGVDQGKAPDFLTPAQRALRNQLRACGRQAGDVRDERSDAQPIDHLVGIVAYEHWHRMLFSRFLAENDLLLESKQHVPVSLADVEELARAAKVDMWDLAGRFAQRMLPAVFRADDPVLALNLAPETRHALEKLVADLPKEVFLADDSLGWTYQFWQAQRKEEVNASGKKIGADELPSVTQLFTEDYMVDFLLDNTLGAWHAGKVLAANHKLAQSAMSEEELRNAVALPGCPWKYLRFVRTGNDAPDSALRTPHSAFWTPAAGTFDGWPKTAQRLKCLDPCMGSGHFVVAMFGRVVAMRMAEEGLDEPAAVTAVIRDNLFGLEIDPRCSQIAAFNLALAAWRRAGHCKLPAMNLACSGLAPNTQEADWLALASADGSVQNGMARLHRLFKNAPVLGSLINPRVAEDGLLEADFRELQPLLEVALAQDSKDDTAHEMAVTARGLAKAAEILADQFTLVATNVPYLGSGKQEDVLRDYCKRVHPDAKADLATCFIDRSLSFCAGGGSTVLVTPQNWLFLGTYKKLRQRLLEDTKWNSVTRLGEHAFDSTQAAGAFVALLGFTSAKADEIHIFFGLDAAQQLRPETKAAQLREGDLRLLRQMGQKENPDSRIVLDVGIAGPRLNDFADSFLGLGTGDFPHHGRTFWEFPAYVNGWAFQQASVYETLDYGGRECLVAWDFSIERVRGMDAAEREQIHNQDQSGQQAGVKKRCGRRIDA